MSELLPDLTWSEIFRDPWTRDLDQYAWIFIMGFLVTLSCGWVGQWLILRRMALVGDAISHAVLPGLVVAFMISGSLEGPVMLAGAVVAGLVTTALIDFVQRYSRVKADAALGIVFTALFALGVLLITYFAGDVHLDVEHVLFGAIEFVSWGEGWQGVGVFVPWSVVQMGAVTVGVGGLMVLFYKELMVASFDSILAQSLGVPVRAVHFALMVVLSLVVVSAFSAVGAILVVAMLIFPGATLALFFDRMRYILGLMPVVALSYSVGGVHLALFLGSSIAGAMVVVALLLFLMAWLLSPQRGGLAWLWNRRWFQKTRVVSVP